MIKHEYQSRYSRNLLLTALLLIPITVAFVIYVIAEKQIDRANDTRHISFQLADELRHSSDDLTRMARTYVITGEPKYKKQYQDVLDIRDGKKPRPEGYERIYWDLVSNDGKPPRLDSPLSIPFLKLVRQAELTDQEFAKLNEAIAKSDELTAFEFEAMKLAESTGPGADAAKAKALMMLHDQHYHEAVASVMQPIDDFFVLLNMRTENAVKAAENHALWLRYIFIVFGLWLLFMLRSTYKAMHHTLGGSPDLVFTHIARIGMGDFSDVIPVVDNRVPNVMKYLAETQSNLASIDQERRQAEEELTRHRDHLEELVKERTADLLMARDAAEASEELHRTIIQTAMSGFWVVDMQGRLLEVNEAYCRMSGYSVRELLAMSIADLEANENPEDTAARIKKVTEQGEDRFETRHRCKDGSIKDVDISVQFKPGDGGCLVCFMNDITGRKLAATELQRYQNHLETLVAERTQELLKLSQAIEQSPAVIVITDLDGLIEYVNPAFCSLTGYTAEEALGKNPSVLKSGETPPEEYKVLWESITAGKIWQGTFHNKKKNGELYWERVCIGPIVDEAGAIRQFVAIKEDITEQRQAEIELSRYRGHLEELVEERTVEVGKALAASESANRAKSIFLNNMSHELHTPLNAVLGFADSLERDASLSFVNRDKIKAIRKSGEHLLSIVSDVLEMSRIEAGWSELREQSLDLHTLLDDLAKMFRLRAEHKGLSFIMTVDADLPTHIVGDAGKLRQVLINLLSNAVKFTNHGSVDLRAQLAGACRIAVEVKDTGIGIAEEYVSKIFLPFEQVNCGLASHTDGIGLGLATSREFARLMGGDITAECQLGKGCCFRFEFRAPVSNEAPPHIVSTSEVALHITDEESIASDIETLQASPTLEKMTTEWREAFREALVRSNITRIRKLGEEAQEVDPILGEWLLERASRYEIDGLMKLRDDADKGGGHE